MCLKGIIELIKIKWCAIVKTKQNKNTITKFCSINSLESIQLCFYYCQSSQHSFSFCVSQGCRGLGLFFFVVVFWGGRGLFCFLCFSTHDDILDLYIEVLKFKLQGFFFSLWWSFRSNLKAYLFKTRIDLWTWRDPEWVTLLRTDPCEWQVAGYMSLEI